MEGLHPHGELDETITARLIFAFEEAFNKADLLVILNNHPYFQNMPISKLSTSMNKCGLIYDMWNNFSANELRLENGIGYIGFGNLAQAKLPAK